MGSRSRVGVVASLWLLVVALTAYEIAPASVLPVIEADLGIGETAASWIVSALLLSMALFGIPAGVALDRRDEHRVLAVAMTVAFLAIVVNWWAGTEGAYWILLGSRFVGGATLVTVWTAALGFAGSAVVPSRQATAIGALTTAVPAGFAVGHLGSPIVADGLGWPATFPVFGAVAGVGYMAFLLTDRYVSYDRLASEPATLAEIGDVLTSRVVLMVGVMGFVAFSLNLLFNSWLPSYVVDEFSLSLALGGLTSAIFPAVGIVSRASSGPVSERVFGNQRRPVVLLGFVVVTPMVVAIGLVGTPLLLMAILAVTGFAVQFSVAILFTYARELVDPQVAGTAIAVLNTVGFLGAFSAPIVAGLLIEQTGTYLPVFVFAGVLSLTGVVFAWLAPDT